MANRNAINTDAAPPPAGPYSHGIVAGGFLYTAGMAPLDTHGNLVGETVTEQTRQVMKNLLAILAAHGLDASDLVKSTVHLAHLDRDFQEFNAAYHEFLVEPYPVRTTVGSTLANILVEIDVVAVCR